MSKKITQSDNLEVVANLSRTTVITTAGGLSGMVGGIILEGVTGLAAGTAVAPLVGTMVGAGVGVTLGLLSAQKHTANDEHQHHVHR